VLDAIAAQPAESASQPGDRVEAAMQAALD